MKIARAWYLGAAVFGVAGVLAAGPLTAQVTVTIDADDIGGVVTGPNGPEAGVWVIAETTDLGTKMAKMVVTDDQGRYVLPDLPKAKYKVWVRGYGLVDSRQGRQRARQDPQPDARCKAPNEAAAAEYYPAIYWYSMIKVPDKGEFPGTGPSGNGINPNMKTQGQFLDLVKTNGCVTCHQLGNKATRTIPTALGEFKNGYEAWTRRIQSGQAATNMVNTIERMGTQGALKMFGDWTDRIAEGELPATKPQRPQGIERNVVITVWDWSNPKAYLHDATASDKRNPTRQRQRPDLRRDREHNRQGAGARSGEEHRLRGEAPGPRSEDAVGERRADVGALAVFRATRRSGTPRPVPHSLYYDEKAASGSPPESVRRPIRTSARRAPTIRRRRCSRSTRRAASSRCTIRRRRSSR